MSETPLGAEQASEGFVECASYLLGFISGSDAKNEATAALVAHHLSEKDVDTAAELADELKDPNERDRQLIWVIGACVDLGDDDYAFQLQEALEMDSRKSEGMTRIAVHLAKRGDFEKAKEIAMGSFESNDALSQIAVYEATAGNLAASLETIDRIDYPKFAVDALLSIASGLNPESIEFKAGEILSRAETEAAKIDFLEERIKAQMDIGFAYLALEDADQAKRVFASVVDRAKNLETAEGEGFVSSAAIGLVRTGNIEEADEALDLIKDRTQAAACLYGFSRVFKNDGDNEEATDALTDALDLLSSQGPSDIRDSRGFQNVAISIAGELQSHNLDEEAMEAVGLVDGDQARIDAYTLLGAVLCSNGRFSDASALVEKLPSDDEIAPFFVGLGDAAIPISEEEALGFYEKAAEALEQVGQTIRQSMLRDDLSDRFLKLGAADRARELAGENLANISAIRDTAEQITALLRLRVVYESLDMQVGDEEREVFRNIVKTANW
ncbi:MAG: hypothetical protein R2684_10245 [Pyrinomonadaceae bacterium]